jgi:hypothetical protein
MTPPEWRPRFGERVIMPCGDIGLVVNTDNQEFPGHVKVWIECDDDYNIYEPDELKPVHDGAVERLAELIEAYAVHKPYCCINDPIHKRQFPIICNCGLNQLQAALQAVKERGL